MTILQPNYNLIKPGQRVFVVTNGHEQSLTRFQRGVYRGLKTIGPNEFVSVEITDGPTGMPRRRITYALPKGKVFLQVPQKLVYSKAIYKKR